MKRPAFPTRPAEFIGSALDDLSDFPMPVKKVVGHAIYLAQIGGKHSSVKPLTGGKAFKGAGVLEVVEDFDGDTFRAVYTLKFVGVSMFCTPSKRSRRRGYRRRNTRSTW